MLLRSLPVILKPRASLCRRTFCCCTDSGGDSAGAAEPVGSSRRIHASGAGEAAALVPVELHRLPPSFIGSPHEHVSACSMRADIYLCVTSISLSKGCTSSSLCVLQLRADTTGINSSHIIHRVSFGPMYPGQVNPLDGGALSLPSCTTQDVSTASSFPLHVCRQHYISCCKECLSTCRL